MDKEEALFFVALLVFVGIIIYEKQQHPVPDVEAATIAPPVPVGPAYLTYNAPWRFGPPMQNILPYATAGMQGQVADVSADCGCSGAQQRWS